MTGTGRPLVSGGRDEQFHGFVLQQRTSLLRTATLLTAGDGHLAEDLVQTVLTRLYVRWPAFRAAENRSAYARRALTNALVDERRRAWRRREHVRPELPERAVPDDGDRRTDEVYRALADLPPRMRAAVVFRYFHDLSVADTAAALDCSQGTVKSQTARALDKLRERLGDVDVPDHDGRPAELRPRVGATAVSTPARSAPAATTASATTASATTARD